MPLRKQNPFEDPRSPIREDVNPFLNHLLLNMETQELPILAGSQLRKASQNWRKFFHDKNSISYPQNQELVVEIGCYKGKTLVEMALAHPEKLFIGVDITYKRVVLTAKRIKKYGLTNAVSVLAHVNAASIAQLFAANEISQCLIFFPDPWSKPKQAAHRLMSEAFVISLGKCLDKDAKLWFKTDQEFYFQETSMIVKDIGFTDTYNDIPEGLAEVITPFESTFTAQNLKTYSAVWQKDNNEI